MATVPYPHVGAAQHLCLVRHPRGKRPSQPALMLDWQRLPDTVLASAFCDRTVAIPTGLPAPNDVLELPDLSRSDLREQIVVDARGERLGYLLHVPGLYVHANQVLANVLAGNTRYNYGWAISRMVTEAAHQLCGVLKRGVLRVRQRPGLMAHAQDVGCLPADCIGISEEFATKLLPQVQEPVPWITSPWDLDGFPVYAIRFPLANEWGIQEMTLRILPGQGRYIAANPWTLGKRWLGDADGDCLFALLRVNEVREKRLEIRQYREDERIVPSREIQEVRSRLTLQRIRNPVSIPELDPKTLDRIQARFDTVEQRQ